jgi:hypothetical protein
MFVCAVDRHFPDKAIDLLDDACTTAARKMMQIHNQEMNTTISSCTDKMKELIVGPDHVAHVGTLFLVTLAPTVSIYFTCFPCLLLTL